MQSSSSGGPNRHFVLGGLAALPRCFVAVASGFTMAAWPTKIVTAKIVILGLDSASANQ